MLWHGRGATGAAPVPKLGKTPITQRLDAAAPPRSILQNQGKTAVLLVLPPMAPLIGMVILQVLLFSPANSKPIVSALWNFHVFYIIKN